jgi:hypothetical protein
LVVAPDGGETSNETESALVVNVAVAVDDPVVFDA